MDQDNMHPDKVPLAFGIKIEPHHHTPFIRLYLEIGMGYFQDLLNANQTSQ